MQTLKFKTTIMCGGCLARVKPTLDNSKEIITWDIDLDSPDKILTVDSDHSDPSQIVVSLSKIGFSAELV